MNVSPKTAGATGGSAVGGAISVIVLWIFGTMKPGIVIPPEVAAAITLVISAVTTFIGGYFPHSAYNPPTPPAAPPQGA